MSTQHKQVIAACVSPFDSEKGPAPLNVLAASFYAVIRKAFNENDLIDLMQKVECVLFVEGPKAAVSAGPLQIMRMPLEMVDNVAEAYLAMPKDPGWDGAPDRDAMLCALGSSVFCQDVIRFLGMGRDGRIGPAFQEFADHVMRAEQGQVVWTDITTTHPFHTGDLVELFFEAKKAGVIPG